MSTRFVQVLAAALMLALPLFARGRRPAPGPTGETPVNDRKLMFFYLDRLRDREFVRRDTDGNVWYTAAEELGLIGAPAIPHLVAKLDTPSDFERGQSLYALQLAAQHEDVMVVTSGAQPPSATELLPPVDRHPQLVREWKAWYARFRHRLP